jgi:hypothetical protein
MASKQETAAAIPENTALAVQDLPQTALVTDDNGRDYAAEVFDGSSKSVRHNFPMETEEDIVAFIKAQVAPDKRLKEMANGEVINMCNIMCATLKTKDMNTGEPVELPRIIIRDDKGITYSAASFGVLNAMSTIVQQYGAPSAWTKPIPVKAMWLPCKKGQTLVLLPAIIKR